MIVANKEIFVGSAVIIKQQGIDGYFIAARGIVKSMYYIDPETKNFNMVVIKWDDGAESKIIAHKIIIESFPLLSTSATSFDALRNIFI